jgi:hypothetical protein
MNDKTKLTSNDILGRKVVCVYELKLDRVGRFQNGLTFVQLDSGVLFNLDALKDPKPNEPLSIWSCDREKAFVPVLSIENEPNLDSPIKAIIFAAQFVNSTAILLENNYILTINIGEYTMGYTFYPETPEFCNFAAMKIAE